MNFWLRRLPLLFICTSFLSAGLLFLSEPMIGKLLLPLFGGTPAVWNTCLVFFQAVLLLGYTYAHLSIKGFGLRLQPRTQVALVLLPLLVLPVALPAWADSASQSQPVLQILGILIVSIGGPFFALATSGPLLQRWFSATNHPRARHPYFLYVASNVGSFVALLGYPLLVEPTLTLRQQAVFWAACYGLFAALTIGCVVLLERFRAPVKKTSKLKLVKTSSQQRISWLFLAFLPSSLMLGVTTYITTDVAAVPLLWIVPLALYLLTFIMAFGVKRPLAAAESIVPMLAAGLFTTVLINIFTLQLPRITTSLLYLAMFTLVGLVAHGRLAASRPEPLRLTEFYLWVSLGGVLGGVFNSLLAPVLFNDVYELPLTLLLTLPILVYSKKLSGIRRWNWLLALMPGLICLAVLVLGKTARHGITPDMASDILLLSLASIFLLYRRPSLAYSIGLLPVLVVPLFILAHKPDILHARTFYGVIQVQQFNGLRLLAHGVTNHGIQYVDPKLAQEPTTYFNRQGPFGDIVRLCRDISSCHGIGILGLGAGTMAAYGETGDIITFYEINPAIAKIAANPQYFTYLQNSQANVSTIIGDGRLSLGRSTKTYDLLVIDAFSSDAVPMHLLTREAFKIYQSKLNSHGLIALDISNRYVNLETVLKAIARDQHMTGMMRFDIGDTNQYLRSASKWVILAKEPKDLTKLVPQTGWRSLHGRDIKPWTDNYSNILDALY